MIGCGAMGGAIARRLLGLGYPLNVYNRSPGKTRSLARAGAIVHATPLKAARASDVIISVVTDAAAVRDVLFSAGGALRVPHGARLVIELGTHCPEAIRGHRGRGQCARGAAGRSADDRQRARRPAWLSWALWWGPTTARCARPGRCWRKSDARYFTSVLPVRETTPSWRSTCWWARWPMAWARRWRC
ncbi:NAD(P)-binding domain-containing protein [Massilia sp. H-1]|nr:NAD(P)-binding domain-containing protein [Massilia sp. H-1]